MGRHARVLTGGVLLLAQVVTACTSWKVLSVSPQELVSRDHPSAIQVREQGGARYVMASPRLEGDSLTGYVKRVERRIPMVAIDRVAVRRFNALKTVGLVVVVPAALIAALVGIVCAGGSGCSSFSGGFGTAAGVP